MSTGFDTYLKFLDGQITDGAGLYVADYLAFNFDTMETNHEWVQWAFPIHTISPHNPTAPLLTRNENSVNSRATSNAYGNYNRLVFRFLDFVGIRSGVDFEFDRVVNVFQPHAPHNHNVKRVSRFLWHCMLTGKVSCAQNCIRKLNRVAMNSQLFTANTVAYWNAIVYDTNNVS